MCRQKEAVEGLIKNTKSVQKHELCFHGYNLFQFINIRTSS